MTEDKPSRGKHLAIVVVLIVMAAVTAVGFFYMKHSRFPTVTDLSSLWKGS